VGSPGADRMSARRGLLEVELGFQGVQHTVVDFPAPVQANELDASRLDGGQYRRKVLVPVQSGFRGTRSLGKGTR
jgi:hypothetical protein